MSDLPKVSFSARCKGFAKQRIKDVVLGWYLPRVYREAAQQPVQDDLVLFIEQKQPDMPDSFFTMHAYLEHGFDYRLEFISLGYMRADIKTYYRNCVQMVRRLAVAHYVFLNDASDVVSCVPLRDQTKVAQLWHGCGAFKKWGMSTADLIFGGNRRQLLRHPFYKNLSLVTVSSPEVAWAYREAMVLEDDPDVVQATGVSRTDVFFDVEWLDQSRHDVLAAVPQAQGRRIILYAPTFRGRVKNAEGPDRLDIPAMQEALGRDCVLLIKHHPFVKRRPAIPEECTDFAFDVSSNLPIDALLSVADVCISDYSSLVFEYSLFGRPMAFFAYDKDDYADWRGFYYDYDQLTPGPVFTENETLIDWLSHVDERFDAEQVKAFRDKFMSACDGHSTERIAQQLMGGAGLFEHQKLPIAQRMTQADPDGIDISIVVPAYNAMPYLRQGVQSILAQTYPLERIEALLVDDGSTDGTSEFADQAHSEHPALFKAIHLDQPSGSPAAPRNEGIRRACGTYVFFMDADDWLGPQAVERMIEHAVDWGADVLLAKLVGEGGRDVPKSMFKISAPKVDIYNSKIMWTFGPMKLFKRDLLVENDLRFPSFMPEDISFVLRAYCLANTVSVAADYGYYHALQHDVETQASFGTWNDVESNLEAFEDLFAWVDGHVPDCQRDKVLMRRLFRRDILNMLFTVAKEPNSEKAESQLNKLQQIALPFWRPGMYATCPFNQRAVLEVGLHGSLEQLRAAVQHEEDGTLSSLCLFEWREGCLFCLLPSSCGGMSFDVTECPDVSACTDAVCEHDAQSYPSKSD